MLKMFDYRSYEAKRIAGFRSQLEFQWALGFDGLGLEYLYEPHKFVLDNGVWYLPDFYFPTLRMWAEVKSRANEFELEKAAMLSEQVHEPVVVLEKFPSLRRDYKTYIDGELKMKKFCPMGTKELTQLEITAMWIAKHWPSKEEHKYAKECAVKNHSLEKTVAHLEKQGWHDYLIGGDVNVPTPSVPGKTGQSGKTGISKGQ